jgi:hypothetical protein
MCVVYLTKSWFAHAWTRPGRPSPSNVTQVFGKTLQEATAQSGPDGAKRAGDTWSRLNQTPNTLWTGFVKSCIVILEFLLYLQLSDLRFEAILVSGNED